MATSDKLAGLPRGKALIEEYRARYGDTTLLSFSRGKDSIAVALAIRDHLNVIPVHFTTVPMLSFVEESLDYYERHLFHRRILRLPHKTFYDQLNNYVFQTAVSAECVAAADLPNLQFSDVLNMAKRQEGIPVSKEMLTAVGIRAADSALRRMSVAQHGVIRPSQLSWCPVWDWNKERLVNELKRANIALPVDYLWYGRSFDGIGAAYIGPLKEHRPDDYAMLLKFFPLLEVELFHYEMHLKRGRDEQAAADAEKNRANPTADDDDADEDGLRIEGAVELHQGTAEPAS
jgi:hypothetical protein